MLLRVGDWERECRFIIVLFDNFNAILGMELFMLSNAICYCTCGRNANYGESCSSFVGAKFWGLKSRKSEASTMAALVELETQGVDFPNCLNRPVLKPSI